MKKKLVKKIIVTTALCLCVTGASAQKERSDTAIARTHTIDEVAVTGTRKQHELSSTAPLYMIGQQEMLRLGMTDMADALHRLPGITLRDYGGAGGMKTISVRGFGSKHTGVSYDGILLSECQSGEIDVSRYSLDNVRNLSLVIGDNDDIFIPARQASAPAVLAIETSNLPQPLQRRGGTNGADSVPPPLEGQGEVAIKLGSFGHISPFIRYEQTLSDHFALAATGEYTYAENDYPFTLRNGILTTYEHRTNSRMNSGHGEIDIKWTPNTMNRISAKAYFYDNNRQLPGQVRYYTNLSKEQLHDQNFFAQMQYMTHNRSNWSLKWSAKYNFASSKYKNGLYTGGIMDADYWQREYYSSVCVLYAPSHQWAFDYSADYAFNNLNSSLPTDTRPYRHSVLQSATAKYSNGRLTALARLLLSLYYNGAKDGEGARNMRRLSPSLSVSYKVFEDKDLYVRVSYKNIFRTPTFNESYFFHYGSIDLLPESTDQLNLGVTWRGKWNATTLQMTCDGYVNHVKDKIIAVPQTMFLWTNINLEKVRTLGVDATVSINHRLNNSHLLLLSSNYTYQRVANRTKVYEQFYNNQIAYTPLNSGSCAVGWENPWVNLSVHASGMSSRWANNEHYTDTKVKGFIDCGVTLYRQFALRRSALEARLDLKNIFDTQYEIVRLYPMPGFSYQFSINYKF